MQVGFPLGTNLAGKRVKRVKHIQFNVNQILAWVQQKQKWKKHFQSVARKHFAIDFQSYHKHIRKVLSENFFTRNRVTKLRAEQKKIVTKDIKSFSTEWKRDKFGPKLLVGRHSYTLSSAAGLPPGKPHHSRLGTFFDDFFIYHISSIIVVPNLFMRLKFPPVWMVSRSFLRCEEKTVLWWAPDI